MIQIAREIKGGRFLKSYFSKNHQHFVLCGEEIVQISSPQFTCVFLWIVEHLIKSCTNSAAAKNSKAHEVVEKNLREEGVPQPAESTSQDQNTRRSLLNRDHYYLIRPLLLMTQKQQIFFNFPGFYLKQKKKAHLNTLLAETPYLSSSLSSGFPT